MRIVLDLQACQANTKKHGIGRYSLTLAQEIAREARDNHEIWLVMNGLFFDDILPLQQAFAGLVSPERMVVCDFPGPTDESLPYNLWRAKTAAAIYEHFLSSLNPDIVHLSVPIDSGYGDHVVVPFASEPPPFRIAVSLYDLIPLIYPKQYLRAEQLEHYYSQRLANFKYVTTVLAISENTRQEAVDYLGMDAGRVSNVMGASDPVFSPCKLPEAEKAALFERYGITKPYVMYAPSGFDWRKNIERLLAACADLPKNIRAAHQLVMVGSISDSRRYEYNKVARKVGLSRHECVFIGYVPEADLISLYSHCKLFVFPSLHEGFGLPVLEAMSCGAPVIGSNATSIPEIIGYADALFNPQDVSSIRVAIERALKDDVYRDTLRAHGLARSRLFTWRNTARLALYTLEEAVNNTPMIKGLSPEQRDRKLFHQLGRVTQLLEKPKPTEDDIIRCALVIAPRLSHRTTQRQLLVDISELVKRDAKSGIQRVVRSILREMLNTVPSGFVVKPIYFDGYFFRYAEEYIAEFLGDVKDDLRDTIIDVVKGDIFFGLDFSANIAEQAKYEINRFKHEGLKIYFVVYDILLLRHPEWWPEDMGQWFQEWVESIVEISDTVLCISRAVAEDLADWIKNNPPLRLESLPIEWFHLGADIKNSMPSLGLPDNVNDVLMSLRSRPTFVMVGTIEPRKGYAQTISAFEQLWNNGFNINLVIVGKQGWLVEDLAARLRVHPETGNHLFWLEGISDEFLEEIYSVSSCLLVASEGEGFGLPIIEAAQHKLPVIVRDIPVFREVAGDHAFYFSGLGTDSLSNAVSEWLNLSDKGMVPDSTMLPWLTWEQSAQQLMRTILKDQRA